MIHFIRIASYVPHKYFKDYLSPPDHPQTLESKDILGLDVVIQTLIIPRSKTALAATSNTSTPYIVPNIARTYLVLYRKALSWDSLGKETVRKELEKVFVCQEYVMAEVLPTNTASLQLCQSLALGARWACGYSRSTFS